MSFQFRPPNIADVSVINGTVCILIETAAQLPFMKEGASVFVGITDPKTQTFTLSSSTVNGVDAASILAEGTSLYFVVTP